MALIDEILDAFIESDYMVIATGLRGISYEELKKIIEIIVFSDPRNIKNKLELLYKYNPDTISCDKSMAQQNCHDRFNDNCDCFLPDIEEPYCKKVRKEKLENRIKRNYPEYDKWRESVFVRDDYTCQKCKIKGGELNAHHIKSFKKYPKLRLDINNGITYCIDCYKSTHHDKD